MAAALSLPPNPAQELKVLRDGKELVFKVKPGKMGAELQEQVLDKRLMVKVLERPGSALFFEFFLQCCP